MCTDGMNIRGKEKGKGEREKEWRYRIYVQGGEVGIFYVQKVRDMCTYRRDNIKVRQEKGANEVSHVLKDKKKETRTKNI